MSLNKDNQWWLAEGQEKSRKLFDLVSNIHQATTVRRERNMRCLKLYGNFDMASLNPYGYAASAVSSMPENRVKMNIIASMCDTVSAKISKMKPYVTFLTDGGTYKQEREAKQASQWVSGLFEKNQLYKLFQRAFKDSTIFDIGAVKHCKTDDGIYSERVLPFELYVEDVDAAYGEPNRLYHVKYLSKAVAKALWPKSALAIEQSSDSFSVQSYGANFSEEMVVVIEAWKLPSVEGGDDGQHIIAVEYGVVHEDEGGYKRSKFPFTFFRWSDPAVGFWGQSLAERLTGNQIEINKMMRVIQTSFQLGSAFKVFIEQGSKVIKEHLNNDIGSIVYYSGTKPDYHVPQTVHPEYFSYLETLIERSYNEAGISQLSATSQKPAGLDSRVALREYNDIETERFVLVGQNYEDAFLDAASHYLAFANEIEADGGDVETLAFDKKQAKKIKWSQIKIDVDNCIVKKFATNMLPHTPAGKLQMVQELLESQIIPQEFALELLDYPDMKRYATIATSGIDNIWSTVDSLLDGDYQAPEPFQNLQLGVKIMQAQYLEMRANGMNDDALELFRRWIAQAESMMGSSQQGAMTQQAQIQQSQAGQIAQQPGQAAAGNQEPGQ